MTDATDRTSIQHMADEIFTLTKLSWRQRLASRSSQDMQELSESQFLTLDSILLHGEPQNVGDIQRSIGVLPAQMSRIIRSLERDFDKPLIHCKLNPEDKRKIDVLLTPAGRKAHQRFRDSRVEKTLDILTGLSEQDRLDFNRICGHIRDLYTQNSAFAK